VNSRDLRQSLSNYMIYIQLFVAIKQRYRQCRREYIRTSQHEYVEESTILELFFPSSGSTVTSLSDL